MTLDLPTPRPNSSRRRSLVEAVCSIQPHYVLLVGLLPGFGLIFGSLILHIATWTARAPRFASIDREVGYLPALNWSLTYAILFPLILYLMAKTLSALADALDQLHARGMVRTRDMEPVRDPVLTSTWLAVSPWRTRLLLLFAVILPTGYGLTEWFLNNFLRLVHVAKVPSKADYDWGLAGIMPLAGRPEWSLVHRLINALFDLLSFSTEILLTGSLFAFFIIVLDLGRVMPSGQKKDFLLLLPDLDSDDRRLGFEEFAYPLELMLVVAFLAYLICYLVRLEGAYLASSNSPDLADFVSGDILAGIKQAAQTPSPTNLVNAFVSLFRPGEQQIRGALAWLMSVLMAIVSLATVMITVRDTARSAKRNALRKLRDNSFQVIARDQASVIQKINDMVFWPLGYLSLDALIFWVIVAVLTLTLYRIGLFVAGIVCFVLFLRLVKRLVQAKGT